MNHKPSLLFVLPWDLAAAGGVNQVVINLAREAARAAHLQPIVFCADWEQDAFNQVEFDGLTVFSGPLRAPLSGGNPARNLAGFALHLRHEMALWREFLERHNVHVINAHYPNPGYMLFSLMRTRRRPKFRLVYSLHGADVSAIDEAGKTERAGARWMLKQADALVSCSADLTERAGEQLKLGKHPIATVHNGIDIAELDRAKRLVYRPDIGGFDNYLVNVATYEHKKGQDVLIDAYLQLVRNGLNSALLLIGRTTPHLAALRSKVRHLGLQDHVFFIPDLDHARTLAAIRHARLLVQPSREEPFGITLLEAAYMRTPIVASQVGGIPEVLGSYYPYLVKPDDAAALAQCIDDALFNPTETERQVKLQRRRVATHFTWSSAYAAYEALWTGAR